MDSVKELAQKAAGDEFSHDEISLFDIYTGERIEQNRKSLAFSLTFRNTDKTPEDCRIEQVFEKIVIALKEHLEFTLRA